VDELTKPSYVRQPGDRLLPGYFERPPTAEEYARRLAQGERVVAFDPDNLLVYVRVT
jgi:hypothetical protein